MEDKCAVASETADGAAPDGTLDSQSRDRREFLKQVGQVSVAAPAAALLLSVSARPALGTIRQYGDGKPTFPERPYDPPQPDTSYGTGVRAWIRFLVGWLS